MPRNLTYIERFDALMMRNFASRGTMQIALESSPFFLLSVAGLVGNVLVCVAVYGNTTLRRQSTNIAVVGLAVSDVLMCSLVSPFVAASLIKGRWIFSESLCNFQAILSYALAAVSLYLMALTAVNRYFCVVKPTTYTSIFTRRSMLCLVLATWFVQLVFGCMAVLYFEGSLQFYFNHYKATCVIYLDASTNKIMTTKNLVSGLFLVLVPITVLFVLYISIFYHVRRHAIAVAATLGNSDNSAAYSSSRVSELKMTKIMFAIVFAFLLCWVPIIIIDIDANSRELSWRSIKRPVALIATFLEVLSSVTNPWIISIMNRSFRNEIKAILRCRQPNRQ